MAIKWKFWQKDKTEIRDTSPEQKLSCSEPSDMLDANPGRVQKSKKKTGWITFLTASGSVAAGLAALALGDPTAGVATATICGAVLSLVSPTKNLVENISTTNESPLELQLVMELRGIHQVLRSMLLMLVFGVLAYCFNMAMEIVTKQFNWIDDNPIIFIMALILGGFYFGVIRKSN